MTRKPRSSDWEQTHTTIGKKTHPCLSTIYSCRYTHATAPCAVRDGITSSTETKHRGRTGLQRHGHLYPERNHNMYFIWFPRNYLQIMVGVITCQNITQIQCTWIKNAMSN